jgi:hypothetical protein
MITLEQAINLGYGSHIQYINHQGRTIRLKINGKVRTWKKDQSRIEIPVKYGLYEYGILNIHDLPNITLS